MKRFVPLAATTLMLLLGAPAAHAISWTEIPSGTAATITNIEYQGPGRFWFTTSAGGIFKRQPSGSFTQVSPDTSIPLNDIEFQNGGPIGLAVGNGGKVLRSVNSGDSWTPVTGIPVSKKAASSTSTNCTASEPLGDVSSVRFAGNDRAWIFAEGSQLARSQPATPSSVGATGQWVDANRSGANTCKVDKPDGTYNDGLADGFFSPINPDVGWIVQGSFAAVFGFTDNLAGVAMLKKGDAGNAGGVARALTGDPADPQRMWSVNPDAYGLSTTSWTDDGYATSNWWTITNAAARPFPKNGPYDVDFRGGTVLSAGNAGMILMSVNGRDFSYVDDAALPAQDWRSVGLADAANAAVGGVGGKLIISTNANVVADPVVPIVGVPTPTPVPVIPPPPVTAPQLGVATLNGGSSKAPLVGGAAKKQGKNVVFEVKGTLGLPSGVTAKQGCNGTVTISIVKGKKRLASKRITVDVKCGYKKTIKVKKTAVGTSKKVSLQVAFAGNASLAPLTSTYQTKVK